MEVFILMQVRRKELTNERRTRAWQNCMVQDKRLELLRRRQRDLNPPCLPIPPILHIFYIQPANTAIIVTLKTVSTMLSYTIRLLARSTLLWSRSISSFLLSRSNLYLHHASPDMKSPRSMFIPPYQSHFYRMPSTHNSNVRRFAYCLQSSSMDTPCAFASTFIAVNWSLYFLTIFSTARKCSLSLG